MRKLDAQAGGKRLTPFQVSFTDDDGLPRKRQFPRRGDADNFRDLVAAVRLSNLPAVAIGGTVVDAIETYRAALTFGGSGGRGGEGPAAPATAQQDGWAFR